MDHPGSAMGARVAHRILLNFSASYSGGGYKRLHAYSRWFDRNGGASFAIHPQCLHLLEEFPRNRYFVVARSHLQRLLDDWSYLEEIVRSTGRPELYYAYGVPLYHRVGELNWSHVNNILTIGRHAAPLSTLHRLKCRLVGRRMRRGFHLADVVSAESEYSLGLLEAAGVEQPFLSINGSDDELECMQRPCRSDPEELAMVVGTHTHKALAESFRLFHHLREQFPRLILGIAGDTRTVPESLRRRHDILLYGPLQRQEVIQRLQRSRFFISTTYVENSYNSAAEGIFLACESYIADIGPHRELLDGERFQPVAIPGLERRFLHVQRPSLLGLNLKSWSTVIAEMLKKATQVQQARLLSPSPLTHRLALALTGAAEADHCGHGSERRQS